MGIEAKVGRLTSGIGTERTAAGPRARKRQIKPVLYAIVGRLGVIVASDK